MPISAKFLADFTQFESATQSAGGKLLAFEGNAAKAGASIQAIETTARATTPILGSMAAQLAGVFTAGAIVAFGRNVLEAGDQIQRMADQTGLSTAEVQKLQYVAGQSGSSIDSLVGAVQNLQQRLGDNNSGAAGAMAKLGINAEAFNRLGTYEQMTTLAAAVRSVKDPTEQASLAAALFGKTWKEILPAIKSGMQEVGDQAPIMADSAVKSLDRIGDALKRSQQIATAWGGGVVLAIEGAGFALGDYLSRFDASHFGVANSQILEQETYLAKLEGRVVQGKPPVLALGEAAKGMGMSFEDASKMAKKLDEEIRASIKTNTEVQAAVEKTAKSLRDYYNWVGERAIEHEKEIENALAREAAAYRAFQNEIGVRQQEDDARAMAAAEAARIAAEGLGQAQMDEAIAEHTARVARAQANDELGKTGPLAHAASASINDLANAFNASAGVIVGAAKSIENAYNAAGIGQNNYFISGLMPKPVQSMATGGPVLRDGPIYAHAGEYVIPKGGGGGGITINYYGSALATKAEIGRAIQDAITAAHMSGGKRMPA